MIAAVSMLVIIGLISIYSSGLGREDLSSVMKQGSFFILGMVLLVGISFFDWRILRNNPYLILTLYLIGIIALVGLLLFGPEIRGVRGWYRIGGISIDPIEYMKVVLLVLVAKYFAGRYAESYRIRHILFTGIYFGIPILLIFRQPDLGSAALLAILWVLILLIAGVQYKYLFGLVLIGVVTFVLGWTFLLHDYQKDRIFGFLQPEVDPLGIGWSQLQSEIAIGNGGILGQGIGNGIQTQHGFLSEPHTDFIFAAIAEEFGLMGVLLVFGLFAFVLWRIIQISLNAENNFVRLFAAGFAILLVIQIFINVGMNIGFLPIVGLPLPFVSYGGSTLVMFLVAIGILQSMRAH